MRLNTNSVMAKYTCQFLKKYPNQVEAKNIKINEIANSKKPNAMPKTRE